MEILELLWEAVPVFEHPHSRKANQTKTKPQINQNMFCFYQGIYKDFTTCAFHFFSFLCALLRSLCIFLAPDHAGNPMDSLLYVRAWYWAHQNWTQDFGCNFLSAEQRGKTIPLLTCWPCCCCHSPAWGWPWPQECPCADPCGACCPLGPSGPCVGSCFPARWLPPCYWVIPSQKQDFIFIWSSSSEPFDVPDSPFLCPIQVPLNSSPATFLDFCWYIQRNGI